MKPVQLELNLWAELEDFQQMLDAVERVVSHLPESQQLQVAGDPLLRIAELCESRAELLTTEWKRLIEIRSSNQASLQRWCDRR